MQPQLPSRVPAVLDGLLTLLNAARADDASALLGVQIIDGPVLGLDDLENDSLAVAPGTTEQPGVVTTYERQPGLGGPAYVEVNELAIVISSYVGESDPTAVKKRRDRVADMLAAFKAIADVNQTREDAWDSLAFGDRMEWYPQQHEGGVTVDVAFSVVARSII